MATAQGGRLPSRYQEVEYLTCNNLGQWLQIPVSADGFEVRYVIMDRLGTNGSSGTSNYKYTPSVILSDPANITMFFPRAIDGIYIQAGGGVAKTTTNYAAFSNLNTDYTVSVNKADSRVISNGTAITDVSVGSTVASSIYLLKGDADWVKFVGRLFFASLYSNHVKVADLVPCYRKSDNKPGMYDLVNNVFYTNQGGGDFTVGPDVN